MRHWAASWAPRPGLVDRSGCQLSSTHGRGGRTDDFDQWLRKLKGRVGRLRIVERLDRLAAGNPGDAKPVGQGVWELRLRFGPGYRVYYLHDGPRVVLLLCGGDKSTQQRDIDRAYQLAEEYWSEEGRGHG